MTDQRPYGAATTVIGLLSRAAALFAQADRLLSEAIREDPRGRWTDDRMIGRATQIAEVASAGARVAQAMVGAEHLDLLREFEGRVDARAASDNGQPDAFPCPDCDYVADSAPRLGAHLALAHHRDPYDPPTPSGPYDPDRTHDR